MNATEVERAILDCLRQRLGVEVASSEVDLIEAGVLDSMMFVDLIMFIEDQFQVTAALEDLEIENFASVAKMAQFVVARSAAAERSAARHG
jgi:methoxymalonate biosynthesis acyl carrier protein